MFEDELDTVNGNIGALLKKKKVYSVDGRPVACLISTLQAKLYHNMSLVNRYKWHGGRSGTVLCPSAKDNENEAGWTSPSTVDHSSEGALEIELSDFDSSQIELGTGNKTIDVKSQALSTSERFSFNVAAPKYRDYFDVLFYFNPRQFEKGVMLALNDKQEGMCGHSVSAHFNSLPHFVFIKEYITLIIQISGNRCDVMLNVKCRDRTARRSRSITNDKCSLNLQLSNHKHY